MFHRWNQTVNEGRADSIQIGYFLDRLKVSISEYNQTVCNIIRKKAEGKKNNITESFQYHFVYFEL